MISLDKSSDFSITGVRDVHRLQKEITNMERKLSHEI